MSDENMDSRYKPLFETFGQETGQAIIDFAEEQWQNCGARVVR